MIDFTSRQLRGFLLVAQHRSFSRAAGAMFITPSGLSILIRELETQLGVRLFERTTRHVALTALGTELITVAQRNLQQLDAVMSRIGQSAIDVVEAKFSTGPISLHSSAVTEAQQQVRSTIQRLAQFSLDHPMILRTRSRLARAIVHRIHLGVAGPSRSKYSKELLEAVLDPHVKIIIGGNASGSIHAWSVDGTTRESQTVLAGGESLCIHSRDTALLQLKSLSSSISQGE